MKVRTAWRLLGQLQAVRLGVARRDRDFTRRQLLDALVILEQDREDFGGDGLDGDEDETVCPGCGGRRCTAWVGAEVVGPGAAVG